MAKADFEIVVKVEDRFSPWLTASTAAWNPRLYVGGTADVWPPYINAMPNTATVWNVSCDWECSYCGSVHPASVYKCPNCGAPKAARQ